MWLNSFRTHSLKASKNKLCRCCSGLTALMNLLIFILWFERASHHQPPELVSHKQTFDLSGKTWCFCYVCIFPYMTFEVSDKFWFSLSTTKAGTVSASCYGGWIWLVRSVICVVLVVLWHSQVHRCLHLIVQVTTWCSIECKGICFHLTYCRAFKFSLRSRIRCKARDVFFSGRHISFLSLNWLNESSFCIWAFAFFLYLLSTIAFRGLRRDEEWLIT